MTATIKVSLSIDMKDIKNQVGFKNMTGKDFYKCCRNLLFHLVTEYAHAGHEQSDWKNIYFRSLVEDSGGNIFYLQNSQYKKNY